MGIIGSIIASVIILVIAIVIVQIIFNPYYLNSLRVSLSNVISSLINGAQTALIKTTVATQSNKPILYIAENSNDTVALFDMQYNKIIGYVNLSGASPNNMGMGPNNRLYVTGSYYNYHNPQYHGIISVVNTSSDKVISTISMLSVPTKIVVSSNGTYVYTINSNNTESSIDLQNLIVTGSFPFTTQYPNITGTPEDLILSPNGKLLFILVNYGNCLYQTLGSYGQECSDETLFAVNTSDVNQTMWSIQLTPDNIYSSGPKQMAVSPDGNTLYAIIGSDVGPTTTLAVINATTEKEVKTITFGLTLGGGSSLSMSPIGGYIYAVDTGMQQDIAVINTSTESIVDTKGTSFLSFGGGSPVDFAPEDVAVSSNFTYVVGSDTFGGYHLLILNRANDGIVNLTGLSGCPCEIKIP